MAEEKKITTKAELRAKAEELVPAYNEAVQTGDFNTANKLNTEIEQAVNEYTAIARKECFDRLASTDDPMLEAVKELSFMTIKIKDTKTGEEKIPVRTIEDSEKAIDLLKLHKHVKGGIGKDGKWAAMIEKFNFHMTVRQAKRITKGKEKLTNVLKEISDSYAMCKIAHEIEMGKDPTSNTKLLATLQSVINAMIGEEYKATSHDVNYLVDLYASKGKGKLKVNCANHSFFRSYIAAICHGIVTGRDYDTCFKKVNAN